MLYTVEWLYNKCAVGTLHSAHCSIRRNVRIKQLEEFLKSGSWLRRNFIMSAGVFYFESACIEFVRRNLNCYVHRSACRSVGLWTRRCCRQKPSVDHSRCRWWSAWSTGWRSVVAPSRVDGSSSGSGWRTGGRCRRRVRRSGVIRRVAGRRPVRHQVTSSLQYATAYHHHHRHRWHKIIISQRPFNLYKKSLRIFPKTNLSSGLPQSATYVFLKHFCKYHFFLEIFGSLTYRPKFFVSWTDIVNEAVELDTARIHPWVGSSRVESGPAFSVLCNGSSQVVCGPDWTIVVAARDHASYLRY